MKTMMIAALVLALWRTLGWAASPCQSTRMNREWRAGCFEQDDGGRQVKAAYRKNIHATAVAWR
jgi:hypothetical protein